MSNLPQIIEYSNQRILTTPQLAKLYGSDSKTISYNFIYNKGRYVEGKHHYELVGDTKKIFINDHLEIPDSLKNAKTLYLWTEKGALLHAKSLGTDEAWDMYEKLVDDYYRMKEIIRREESLEKSQEFSFLNSLYLRRLREFKKTAIPFDQFAIYQEVADFFFYAEIQGFRLPDSALPDGSVGIRWCAYASDVLGFDMKNLKSYNHVYPDRRGIRSANLYPVSWLPAYRKWFTEVYLPENLPEYLKYLKVKKIDIDHVMLSLGSYLAIGAKKG